MALELLGLSTTTRVVSPLLYFNCLKFVGPLATNLFSHVHAYAMSHPVAIEALEMLALPNKVLFLVVSSLGLL